MYGNRHSRHAGIAITAAASIAVCGIAFAGVGGAGGVLPDGYCPPLISNGDLNMLVDWWGGQGTNVYFNLRTEVYWQGRRGVAREAPLFGFGRFNPTMSIDGVDAGCPGEWTQTLDITNAIVETVGRYAGVETSTRTFCALHRNVVGVRRTFTATDGKRHSLTCGMDYNLPPHDRLAGEWKEIGGMRRYTGRTYGHRVTDFTISVVAADGGGVSRSFSLAPGETRTVDWFIVFTDTLELENVGDSNSLCAERRRAHPPVARADALCRELARGGWDGLFSEHSRRWNAYFGESFVRVPDARLQRMYDVAQYHLRCNAGRWGFPVGIFPHHWQGKYFGFDATYMHDGLVASGHFDVARRCPDWRHAVMPWAERRQGYYQKPGRYGARWMWMSLEDGDIDVAGIGFWQDHIFAMGTIARSAWTQYLYSRDVAWLAAKGYPVIRNCALFFRNNWVFEDGGGVAHIGRCTDLERLGPSRDRAFLTTCGAIYAMRAAADAAGILSTNATESADFRAAADRLVKGLPVSPDGTRYVAYEGCEEESVGTLGGLYPFPVFRSTDTLQANAARHFIAAGRAAGNMYPMGTKVCPWYAGKMAASMIMLGDSREPYRWLSEAASAQGLFGETWEINEPGLRLHPWFATASGMCAYALAQMLVAEIDGVLHIAPGVPDGWKDYAFRLPSPGGAWVECEVRDGKVVHLSFKPSRDAVSTIDVRHVFRQAR
ncbi:MAG: hypothetical protein IKO72_06130 [Kiritimatiellae bacterium]|nr:hypothetical protein [Kiritimatiellia bacterium]